MGMMKNSRKGRRGRPRNRAAPPACRGPQVTQGRGAGAGMARGPVIPAPDHAPGASAGSFDVIVLGAGASGLACAAEAGRRGLSVLLLERGPRPGRKLAVSGGGRANFSTRSVTPGA